MATQTRLRAPGSIVSTRRAFDIEVSVGVIGLVLLGAVVVCGVVNADEGWYVAATRSLLRGELPYRDFAFTQTPLSLFVYAPSQALAPGITSARWTAALLSTATLVVAVWLARRLAGRGAAIATGALLLAGFPRLLYWLAITKTYAPAALAATVSVAALATRRECRWGGWVAALAAGCFAASRATGVVFAIPVIGLCAVEARSARARFGVVGAGVVPVAGVGVLAVAHPSQVAWNLYGYHSLAGGAPNAAGLVHRLVGYGQAWPLYFLVVAGAAGVTVVSLSTRRWLRDNPDVVVASVGGAGFLLANAAGGAYFPEEYAVPVIPCLVAIGVAVVAQSELIGRTSRHLRAAAVAGIAAAFVLVSAGGSYLGRPGWSGAPSSSASLSRCIAAHSRAGDQVLAPMLEDLVTARGRRVLAGTTLGIFSYENVSPERAAALHVLDRTSLLTVLDRQVPSVVVLTKVEWSVFGRAGFFAGPAPDPAAVRDALVSGYEPVCTARVVRQTPNLALDATVYARR